MTQEISDCCVVTEKLNKQRTDVQICLNLSNNLQRQVYI